MTMKGELLDRDDVDIDHRTERRRVVRLAQRRSPRPSWSAPAPITTPDPVAVGVGCAGPVRPDVVAVSPTEHRRVAVVPAAFQAGLGHQPQRVRRPRRQGAGPGRGMARRGAGSRRTSWRWSCRRRVEGGIVLNGQLLDGATGNAGHVGHIVVEPNGRRCAVRFARLPRCRGVGPGDRGHHRPHHRGADLRDHATHRSTRRPGRGHRCATCSISISPSSADRSRSVSARRSSTRRRRRSTSTRSCRSVAAPGSSRLASAGVAR